jgi:xylitol oxidase
MPETQRNWAGNYTYQAARLHYPTTLEQIQELVSQARKVRVLGSRHSFNDIADSPEDLISLAQYDPGLEFDRERHTVTIGGGVTYGRLGPALHQAGYALPNLASLPHIAVAGACATATHGSGVQNGNLATVVAGLELVAADGTLVRLSRAESGDQFAGAVVALGGLGVVTRLTLNLLPTFAVRQDVYENLPLAQLDDHFEEILASAYSVSLFTDWQQEAVDQVWLKRQVATNETFTPDPVWFGATAATVQRHPILRLSAAPCTEQLGVPGPWHDRLPHFRMEFTPSSGEELQTEYFVPRPQALAAFHAITRLRDQIGPLIQVSEIRTIAADDLWMSPCYQQDCVAFHFTWIKDWARVRQLLPQIEAALAPFAPRPHWGKLFTMPVSAVQAPFVRLPDFRRLLGTYDPHGKFRNAFLDRYIFGTGSANPFD